jgi:hypothetical protein
MKTGQRKKIVDYNGQRFMINRFGVIFPYSPIRGRFVVFGDKDTDNLSHADERKLREKHGYRLIY